jgi:hypothetical protein
MSLESFLSHCNLLRNAGKRGGGEGKNSEIVISFDIFLVLIIGA